MNNLIFFDSDSRDHLLPLTYTRPVADLRLGILKISEKWSFATGIKSVSYITQNYLSQKFPLNISDNNILINGSLLPNDHLVENINLLSKNQALLQDGELLAAFLDRRTLELVMNEEEFNALEGFEYKRPVEKINNFIDILVANSECIAKDLKLIKEIKKSQNTPLNNSVKIGGNEVFFGENVSLAGCNLDTRRGAIYIGDNVTILPGANLQGPIAILDEAVVKMGACIYGGTTVGVKSTVGGEVKNTIVGDYSNKGHEGYLGDSILGQWCNLGAHTNVSNLKNTFSDVKLYSFTKRQFINTNHRKIGVVMGDYVRTGINTMLNTGTIIGPVCNIYGAGFQPKNIMPFSWGDKDFETFKLDKALDVVRAATSVNEIPSSQDEEILSVLSRNWSQQVTV